MFPLFRDRTRRLICRSMFLLLAVLPTSAVLAWSVVLNGDGYHAAICEQLSAQLGCDVRVRGVSHPRKEITLLEGFELVDPETGAILVRSERVEIRDNGRRIIVSHPEVNLTNRNWLRPIVEQRLRLSAQQRPPLYIDAETIELSWPEGKQTLHHCKLKFDSAEQGNAALATFQLVDQSPPEPIQLQFRREKLADQPLSTFELNTNNSTLPCTLLATVMEQTDPFGKASTFRGKLTAKQSAAGWDVDVFDVVIEQVELQTVVKQYFAGQCAAKADVHLHQARFHRGRMEEAKGIITAGAGVMSSSVYEAIKRSLNLRPPANWNVPAEVHFDQLSAEFQLSTAGLTIVGHCDRAPEGIVLSWQGQPLLWEPAGKLLPSWRW